MVASSIHEARKEAAIQAFKAKFVRNGFQVPEGLVHLLRAFAIQTLLDTSVVRAGVGCQHTYVYPPSLKMAVREIIPGNLVEKPDPTHTGVYKVNIGDLARAKWPATKKKGIK